MPEVTGKKELRNRDFRYFLSSRLLSKIVML